MSSAACMLAERRPARLGELEQLPVAPRLRLVLVGDVVEQQHEAAQRRSLRRGRAHRRHADPQQVPGRRAGHEPRRGRRRVAPRAMRCSTVSQRVRDQRPVDDAVDRAAEPDQLRAAAGASPTAAEQRARPLVVEQDPAVEVADHHALVQLGHQRAELVALLGHAAARLLHQPRHVRLQRPALAGQRVDRAGRARASPRRPAAPGRAPRRRPTSTRVASASRAGAATCAS